MTGPTIYLYDELNNIQINDTHDLNRIWTAIQHRIISAAKLKINNQKSVIQHKNLNPNKIDEILTQEQIKTHASRRCDHYKDQKKIMINSIIDRHRQTIIIDRILVKKNDTEELIIDTEEIKKHTNIHFQTVAGGIHEEKSIPSF